MNQESMLEALAQLVESVQAEEGPPGITTKEIAKKQGRLEISHPFRRKLNALIDQGFISVQRGVRKNRMGELTRSPVYALTEKGRTALDKFPD